VPETAEEALEPLRAGLVPVAAVPQTGVCEVCRGAVEGDFRQCYPCLEAMRSTGVWPITPITMSVQGGLSHHHLRGYKDDPDDPTRRRMARRLAALVAIFLRHHGGCVGEFDSVAAIPSVRRIALQPVIDQVAVLRGAETAPLTADPVEGRERRADRFQPLRDVRGERVLVLDDTFASGASLFSACAALRDAGAQIVGPLVIGRHVRSNWEPSAQLLGWLTGREWDETRCCRCSGERDDPGAFL
jgi:hypothetical protein